MKCPGCDADARKGTLVLLLDPRSGKHKRQRVCPRCVRRAVLVAAPLQTPIVKGLKVKPAASGDVDRAIRMLTTYGKAARASELREHEAALKHGDVDARAENTAYHRGRAEGFEGALELLRGPK